MTTLEHGRELTCGCGYNLRGLAHEGNCPECGEEVAAAIRWHAHPFGGAAPLRRMSLGLTIVLASHALWLVALIVRSLSESADRYAFWLTGASGPKTFIGASAFFIPNSVFIANLAIPLCHALQLVGIWLLTTPHAYGRARSLRRPGLALRWTAIAGFVAAFSAYPLWAKHYMPTLGCASLVDTATGVLLGMYLAAVGRLLGAAMLRVGGWIVSIGSAVFGATFAAVLLVMSPRQTYWERTLWASLTAWAAIGLFCSILLVLTWRRVRRELSTVHSAG